MYGFSEKLDIPSTAIPPWTRPISSEILDTQCSGKFPKLGKLQKKVHPTILENKPKAKHMHKLTYLYACIYLIGYLQTDKANQFQDPVEYNW